MAIEMANVLRSLNTILESQERRERFDVEASLAGMELAMKREQQRIGERQFKKELNLKRQEMGLARDRIGIAKDELKIKKEDHFMGKIDELRGVVEAEKMKAATGTWVSYFSRIHDSYFTGGEYNERDKKKLINDLNKNIGDKGTSTQIAELIAKYGSSLTENGLGNSEIMIRLAQLMGDKLPYDAKFAKGMMRFMGIDDSYDGAVFQKDFTGLLRYDDMNAKLAQEKLEISEGDYEFTTGILSDIDSALAENELGEEGFEFIRVGNQTVNRQDLVDYSNFHEISLDEAKQELLDIQRAQRVQTGDARLDALLEIEKLSGDERLKAIANQLSQDEAYGIIGYDDKQGFTMGREDIEGEGDIEKFWLDKTDREGQRRQVSSRMAMVEQEMGITNRGIRELEEKMEGRKRAENIMGITYSGTEQANTDAFNLASMKLASEAYKFQTEKLRAQELSLLTIEQRKARDRVETRNRMGMQSSMGSFR